jgi:hypothetical protein
MPNINELLTLVDYGIIDPAIDPVFNNGVNSFTPSDFFFWSSTPVLRTGEQWTLWFGFGPAIVSTLPNNVIVRAVRGP